MTKLLHNNLARLKKGSGNEGEGISSASSVPLAIPKKIILNHLKICLVIESGMWLGLYGFEGFQHRQSERNNIPDRFDYRVSAFYFNKHFKNPICMFWRMSKRCNCAQNLWCRALFSQLAFTNLCLNPPPCLHAPMQCLWGLPGPGLASPFLVSSYLPRFSPAHPVPPLATKKRMMPCLKTTATIKLQQKQTI